eukprot:CAMPEP_0174337738 /NCGR_PEP_ID=MMETSP0810-20121108/22565_1 /TAXON_ID=73025 ORGANISM="Eutreptiella gymnastica-like, Strain CCMP1594" /NCGR_SAMPLE_ID=MMETSP0810 /ASSEMBLY_ACC=CAM_ASM_000659 /LENGTH=59 /DNA_ID=CAMNT_0015457381 /DNA_START=2717 /DNA_END=2894 /DNA_ORIENTATION=+
MTPPCCQGAVGSAPYGGGEAEHGKRHGALTEKKGALQDGKVKIAAGARAIKHAKLSWGA